MNRKKHIKTEFEEARSAYRSSCPRHVVTFETDMPEDMKRKAFAYADRLRILGNELIGVMAPRINQMQRTKQYRAALKDYRWHYEKLSAADPGSERFRQLQDELRAIGSQLQKLQKQYQVTFSDVREAAIRKTPDEGVNSIFALTRGEDIWHACEKVLYDNGKRLHFRKRHDLPIIRAKQPDRGITVKVKDGTLQFSIDGIGRFGVSIPSDDRFLRDEQAALLSFLSDPGIEGVNVKHMMETGELLPVFRPCYAALKCERIRGRNRVYVQVTVADSPVPKFRRDGSPRYTYGKGRVGCDNGSQSFAAVSENAVLLENLAERDFHSTRRSFRKECSLQQKIDRSIRAMNPERFNPDGTPKKIRGPYRKSRHARRLLYLLHEQKRKDSYSRLYAVQTDANRLRSLGDELVIEPGNAKALQRRSKKPAEKANKTITVKTKDGSVKSVRKNKRKKRFGRSILYRCPGAFQAELKKKFGTGYHEVARMFRASQYDHVQDSYIKKKLSERWHHLPDGTDVQRDIYSAFLLYCSNHDYTAPDREICLARFDHFYRLHGKTIQSIINRHYHVYNSGISA